LKGHFEDIFLCKDFKTGYYDMNAVFGTTEMSNSHFNR